MAEHVVQPGESLWVIARRNRIRYWPNLYFATENNEFRRTHPDPSLIFPGDSLQVPDLASIAPMERNPVKVYHDVPLFTQRAETCWRATGKMLYCRRHPGAQAEAAFGRVIGDHFRTLEVGLRTERWREFYSMRLGMTEATIASPNDLHFIIASHGPAVVAIGEGDSSHSMVMVGYDLYQGRWRVLDPAAGEELTFAEDVITVGASDRPDPSPDPARLTGYRTGPATIENMGRWLWILDTTVHQLVYYYP